MSQPILEVCCFSAASAIIAEKAGAHRIEFCANYFEGGTTPSAGNLKWVIENISIPVFPIIRPRGGHFFYSHEEIKIIKKDIFYVKNLGYEGIVVGALDGNGHVDQRQISMFCEWAWPMEVTFHRAFDRVKDPMESLEKILKSGCSRILTGGQFQDALSGIEVLQHLIEMAGDQIIIMPGGGIRASNLEYLLSNLPAAEFHTSALILNPEPFFSPESMNENILCPEVNCEEVSQMIKILKDYKRINESISRD